MEETNFRKIRLEKLEKIKALGWNPYPASFDKKQTIADALKSEGKVVKTAGKIFSYREHGNIAFADLKDESGKIQIFFQKKLLGEEYKNLKLLDIGDYIGVEGEVIKTTAGEISIVPSSYTLLTKSLSSLPSEFFGLKDAETKLRKRYLDLVLDPELREIFRKKNLFWQTVREYLVKDGGLEVETPILVNTTGGADARPFITHHNAFDMEVYLRISPELYLKRLLVAGYEKVFEIGRIFRNEGISDEHLQDYTQMEMYWAYKDYEWLMDFVEKMTQEIIKKVFGSLKTKWKEHTIDWSGKWPRVEFMQLLSEKWKVDVEKMSVKELYGLADKLRVKIEPNLGRGRILDHLYKKTIRPNLIQPMYVINHPVEVEPLAKRLESNPNNVARMQILAMGSELGKGFSELNDPLDQYARFQEQQALRDAGDEEAQMMDKDFVEALEYGMPPAAGFGYSERLFALLMDKPVREMQFFPLMKPEAKNQEQKIEKTTSENVQKVDMKREDAYVLLTKHMTLKNLIKHCVACEAAMKGIYKYLHAKDFDSEIEKQWGITGLLHDVDYEMAQKENKLDKHGMLIFEKDPNIIPEPIAHAIKAHNYKNTKVDPITDMDWAITCVDQLTGIIVASALIHADKKLSSIDSKFVLKRFNTPSFAKGASRETIKLCEEKLGIPLEKFIEITLASMQGISSELGL
ncbi:MAG: lysine--tRNA ligase [bacterium]|nr:lysine--tRNA ligase [bacterium]